MQPSWIYLRDYTGMSGQGNINNHAPMSLYLPYVLDNFFSILQFPFFVFICIGKIQAYEHNTHNLVPKYVLIYIYIWRNSENYSVNCRIQFIVFVEFFKSMKTIFTSKLCLNMQFLPHSKPTFAALQGKLPKLFRKIIVVVFLR